MGQRLRVAIDGPAGAGKSTAAKLLASRLGYTYVDTGAMYRAVTLLALRQGIEVEDENAVAEWLAGLRFELEMNLDPLGLQVLVNGEDVTQAIRAHDVSEKVTVMAKHRCVRDFLFRKQKRLAECPGVVMDGRDIGTVIMPQAEAKFFLVASLQERAKRRKAELESRGIQVALDEVEASIARRDAMDTDRESAPLARAKDAVLIDTTDLTIDQVVEQMLEHIQRVKEGQASAVHSGQGNP